MKPVGVTSMKTITTEEVEAELRSQYPNMPEDLLTSCADHAMQGVIYKKGITAESLRAAAIATARHSTNYDDVCSDIATGIYDRVPEEIRNEVIRLEEKSYKAGESGDYDKSQSYSEERVLLVRSFYNKISRNIIASWQ
jgi:hypothetical protein